MIITMVVLSVKLLTLGIRKNDSVRMLGLI